MTHRIASFLLAMTALTLGGCGAPGPERAADVVAQVGLNTLTRGQLDEQLGTQHSASDSTRLADLYVRSWIKEQLLYDKARDNVDRLEEINREAEAYRRRLIVYEYEQRLMRERLATEISDADLEAFYKSHEREFLLKQPLVKGILLKVPADAPRLGELKSWVKRIDDKSLEKIEKYSLGNALVYDYFMDRWVSLADVMKNIPYDMADPNRFVSQNKSLETVSGGFWYFLYIGAYVQAGQTAPFDYAREEVREALLNVRRKEFVRRLEDELFEEALKKNKIKYYQQADEAPEAPAQAE
jgi:predicted small lipoprotein YifL